MKKLLLGLGLGLGVFGCGASEEQLRSRAAFDLKCPQGQLEITEIDDRTRGVRGCDGQATYVESCTAPDRSSGCTWVMNSDSHK